MSDHNANPGNKSLYAIVTNRILSIIEEGIDEWQPPWVDLSIPTNLITTRNYTGLDAIVLDLLGYEEQLFITERQLREVGGTIKPGERSRGFTLRMLRQDLTLPAHLQSGVTSEKILHVSQCENIAQRYFAALEHRENSILSKCEVIAECMPKRLIIVHADGEPFYDSEKDFISIPPITKFANSAAYYHCLFHQLVQSTGHASRLNRDAFTNKPDFGSKEHYFEKLIAELGAAFLSRLTDIFPSVERNCSAYINGLLIKDNDPTKLMYAISRVAGKAVDYILGK